MADIVLKDRNGNNIEYPGVNHIKVKTTDGETRDFVDSETVPEVIENFLVTPDFSAGDQRIVGPDGYVVKSAIIQKPETLIPENISKGVNIAGIIGALEAGGGVRASCGEIVGTGALFTLVHGLGVIPDVVMVEPRSSPTATALAIIDALQTSDKGAEVLGTFRYGKNTTSNSNKINSGGFNSKPLDYGEASSDSAIYGATNDHVIIGTTTQFLISGQRYHWIAIGGLT